MKKQPNIVFILSDDQGTWSLGSYGNTDAISPKLDQLANEGTRFENFYCTSPVCSPARASILTGKMPSKHGVYDWLGGGSVKKSDYDDLEINYKRSIQYLNTKPEKTEEIGPEDKISFTETNSYQFYMPYENGGIQFLKDHLAYTEVLKANGYTCGLSGKWHLGDSYTPQKGFDYWEVIARGGTNYMLPEYVREGKIKLEEEYVTDLITNDAITFIDEQKEDKPFYLSVHYTAPHDPWEKDDQPKDVWEKYNDCTFESIPRGDKHPDQVEWSFYPKDEEERNYALQGYFTALTAMDDGIGKIIEKLKEKNMYENTIIFFMADNGFNVGHHGIWGKGNGTLPLNLFETSTKIPLIVRGPGISQETVTEILASQYDIFPTIIDYTQTSDENLEAYMKQLPGTSLKSTLAGERQEATANIVVFDEYGPARMIRKKDFKMVYRAPYGPHELYNLAADPEEIFNLFGQEKYQGIEKELQKELFEWFDQYGQGKHNTLSLPVNGAGQMGHIDDWLEADKIVFTKK